VPRSITRVPGLIKAAVAAVNADLCHLKPAPVKVLCSAAGRVAGGECDAGFPHRAGTKLESVPGLFEGIASQVAITGLRVGEVHVAAARAGNPMLAMALDAVAGHEEAMAGQVFRAGSPVLELAQETSGVSQAGLCKLPYPVAQARSGIGAGGG